MKKQVDARRLLETYVGRTIKTVRGQPNTILGIDGDSIIVATKRSPVGEPAPIDDVQKAIEILLAKGNCPLKRNDRSHRSRRYRGSFYLAVLLSLPGVAPKRDPTRVVVTDRDALESFLSQFAVVGQRDAGILKSISRPSPTEFKAKLKTAREQARKAGMKKSDVDAAIRMVRKRA